MYQSHMLLLKIYVSVNAVDAERFIRGIITATFYADTQVLYAAVRGST
mgnify:CR=1 FL=1